MELSRSESHIKDVPLNEFNKKLFVKYNSITLISLSAILSALIVTIIFLIYLIF
jgi:hypothetical protein